MKNHWLQLKADRLMTECCSRLGGGDPNLDFYYARKYVDNERCDACFTIFDHIVYSLAHTAVMASSMMGTVYVGDRAVQSFFEIYGKLSFTPIGEPDTCVLADSSLLDIKTGELRLAWNRDPGDHHITVSYEYD